MISVGFPVTWRDLPAMYWHFFTGNNGQGFPSFILWLAVGGFIGTVGRISLYNGEYERYQLILFCNLVIPVMLVFIISWWMPLFIDRYFFFSSLSIPPCSRYYLPAQKKRFVASVLSYSPYYSAMVSIIITLST